jgi:hypothetical protein
MKRSPAEWLCVAVVAAMWLGYVTLGPLATRSVSVHFGAAILQATQGNLADAQAFVGTCACEALLLLSVALLAVIVYRLLSRHCLGPASNKTGAWAFLTVIGFVLFNVWLAVATHTTLFWCLMWQGEETNNLTRFRLKAAMLRDYPSDRKAVILGSSQARAQLDEGLLNKLLEPTLHTAELHFPGSHAYDIAMVNRKIASLRLQVLICYVSELNFYEGAVSEVIPVFFGFEDLKDCRTLPVIANLPFEGMAYGLLGDLLPAFALRDVISQRLLGGGVALIRARTHERETQRDVEVTRRQKAKTYQFNKAAEFQKQAFTAFAVQCEKQNQQLIILAGQLNPSVARYLDPGLRTDMLSFLRHLRDQHPNLVLLDDLPVQLESDYSDLTHIKAVKQAEFTRYLAEQLKSKILAPATN